MGADYIHTSLHCIAEIDPPTPERQYAIHNFDRTLSWPAGEQKIRDYTAAMTQEQMDDYINQTYDDFEGETLEEQRKELEEAWLKQLAELRECLGMDPGNRGSWRDVGWSQYPVTGHEGVVCVEFSTGGMSHGDTPTDAYDLFTFFYDNGRYESGVIKAVGFLDGDDVSMSVTLPKEAMHWLNPSVP